ncbi:MAG TPA: sulfotransferase [Thermoanaerobaculia bacterium]|nr:sulfotransferase [Thermoanaerobaculia bacterium]
MAVFERPIFIMAPPRSGTTLLFDLCARAPGLWTIGGESHAVIEGMNHLHPSNRGWESNRLTAADADRGTVQRLVSRFLVRLRDRDGRLPTHYAGLRLLEKTPRNCLRLPFLAAAFPDAQFVYLYREPRDTVSSMLDAWRSGKFIAYDGLPDWPAPAWSLLLIPGWRDLIGKELAEAVARQWAVATECLLDDFETLPLERRCVLTYERLISEPQAEIERLCAWSGLEWDRELTTPLPLSKTVLTPPEAGKWRRNGEELGRVMPLVEDTVRRSRTMAGAQS